MLISRRLETTAGKGWVPIDLSPASSLGNEWTSVDGTSSVFDQTCTVYDSMGLQGHETRPRRLLPNVHMDDR